MTNVHYNKCSGQTTLSKSSGKLSIILTVKVWKYLCQYWNTEKVLHYWLQSDPLTINILSLFLKYCQCIDSVRDLWGWWSKGSWVWTSIRGHGFELVLGTDKPQWEWWPRGRGVWTSFRVMYLQFAQNSGRTLLIYSHYVHQFSEDVISHYFETRSGWWRCCLR